MAIGVAVVGSQAAAEAVWEEEMATEVVLTVVDLGLAAV